MILQVKEFNKLANMRYQNAVSEYMDDKRKQPPFKPMYLFYLSDNITPRKNGYVISEGDSHTFHLHKPKKGD